MTKPRIQSRADKAAKAVIENLRARRGLGQEYGSLDLDVRVEMAEKWSRIIADAMVTPADSAELALAAERDAAVEVVARVRRFMNHTLLLSKKQDVIDGLMMILDSTPIGAIGGSSKVDDADAMGAYAGTRAEKGEVSP